MSFFSFVNKKIGKLEECLNCHWLNPLATLYVNFRSFPLSQAVHLPFWAYGRPKFYDLSGTMKIIGKVKCGMIKFNKTRPFSPNFSNMNSELSNKGKIEFSHELYVGCGTRIVVGNNAVFRVNGGAITDFVNVGCMNEIELGKRVSIAHRSQLFDSNYHYIANISKKEIRTWKKSIKIGDGCWVCNSTIVNGGTILPNYSIVASGSVVNKNFGDQKDGVMVGGVPAKVISSDSFVRVNNSQWIKTINEWFCQGRLCDAFIFEDRVSMEDLNSCNEVG